MSAGVPERYVCVHGHFYQPPRENPWLETVEVQDSAAPYHDWNERVTAECYAPNAAARLLGPNGGIIALRNNYKRISFNFGPTLLSWLEQARPDVYAQIVLADQESRRRYGRGNALAQVYGHNIMPLASPRDQQTQVRWGIADFTDRFGRAPDGMWLPETAIDRRTLRVLAENDIRFTILAPSQAARVRYAGRAWEEVNHGGIDPRRPYRCHLGAGREIVIFFYDGDIAHAVAFEGLLNDGRELARRLTAAALANNGDAAAPAPLAHIATDGESYGHHHRFGEMALAAAAETLEHDGQIRLTNYAAYLNRVAVVDEVEVRDNTSWSCAHGVERWRADCGCNSGGRPGWQQAWRTPLRQALDWLQMQLDVLFQEHGGKVLRDPWLARDAYIGVLLQRDAERRDAFLHAHARAAAPDHGTRTRIWKLLEMQRYSLLSFTSCGWFFDDPSGIETVQILCYAARSLQLAHDLGVRLDAEFLHRLEPMRSNVPEYGNGRDLYRRLIRPQVTDHARVAAHYAMNSMFAEVTPDTDVYAFRVQSLERAVERSGDSGLAIGTARLVSDATEETSEFGYAALHLGGHDMHCSVSAVAPAYTQLKAHLLEAFISEPLTELIRHIEQTFGGTYYTLGHLFVAERRRILDHLTAQLMAACTADYERIVSNNRRLLDFLAQARVPLPEALEVATTFVMEHRLQQSVAAFIANSDPATVLAVWKEIQRWRITPPLDRIRQMLEQAFLHSVVDMSQTDGKIPLGHAHAILDLADSLGLRLDLWEPQNRYYVLITTAGTRPWEATVVPELRRLGQRLGFQLHEWDTLAVRAA